MACLPNNPLAYKYYTITVMETCSNSQSEFGSSFVCLFIYFFPSCYFPHSEYEEGKLVLMFNLVASGLKKLDCVTSLLCPREIH